MSFSTRKVAQFMRGKPYWPLIVAWLAFSAWFFAAGPYAVMANQGGVPDEDFGQSASEVQQRIGNMSAGVQQDYQVFLGTDILFAGLYGGALMAILSRFSTRFLAPRLWAVVWLPVAAAGLDVVENLCMAMALSGASAQAFVVAQTLKFVVVVPTMIAAGLAVAWNLVHAIMNPVKRTRR